LLWLAASIPLGFFTFGAIGVVAAVGLVEAPTMLVSWILLRKFNMLNLRQEFLYLGLVAAGAAVGYAGTTEILHLFPRL
jgi:hypothetical protein